MSVATFLYSTVPLGKSVKLLGFMSLFAPKFHVKACASCLQLTVVKYKYKEIRVRVRGVNVFVCLASSQ